MATETGDSQTTTDDTETGDKISPYMRGVTVTTVATLMGMVAAVGSMYVAVANGEPDTFMGLIVLLLAIIVQFPIYQAVGIAVDEFSTKDQLYVFFMTFALWFVTWSLLLTTGALQ